VILSVERRTIAAGPRTLSYLATGTFPKGRVVVFLHAFPLNADMWLPQLQELPEGWSGIAPDFRGFGGSDSDAEDASRSDARLEDYADDIAALMDMLGVPGAALCGCSMGGYAALAMLRRFPGRVSALMLADTRATADSDAARTSRAAMLDLLDREGPRSVAADMRLKLVGPASRDTRPGVLAAIDGLMRSATASGIGFAIARMMHRPDATAQLATFRVGEEDILTPPGEAASMAALVPGASLVTIPRAGHLSNLESPDAFNAAMQGWLAAVAEGAE
jgi:pimeloyl-ACP methyl ester carboxylesterase